MRSFVLVVADACVAPALRQCDNDAYD